MLISTDDYTLFTGATAPDNFEAQLGYVVDRLERALCIFIESAERTEHLWPTSDGKVYPRATPITDVPLGWLFSDKVVFLAYNPYGGTIMAGPEGFTDYGIDPSSASPMYSTGTYGSALQWFLARGISLTYTGGWAPYGSGTTYLYVDGDAGQTVSLDLPIDLAEAIAWGIHTRVTPQPELALPHGIQSLNIAGEFSVTRSGDTKLGADGFPCPPRLFRHADLGGRCLSLAAPYRRVA